MTIRNILSRMLVCLMAVSAFPVVAEHLVIIAANDTHSQIDPTADNLSGVLRRRAIYDHIRSQNPNTVTVHAGDAVQGTVYFTIYKGEVEYALLDSLGYDMVILGNHEFDNGLESLAEHYKNVKATKLSVNYDMSGTPLEGMFTPYTIKRYGDHRVAFFGINVEPAGLISLANYQGITYAPSLEVADAMAQFLKEKLKVDYAVMISHIGYTSYDPGETNDVDIIKASRYIDLVVGGHSHTVVKPGSEMATVNNADGRPITVGQNGKSGKYVATYDLDLETGQVVYNQISVDSTWDNAASRYTELSQWLQPYRNGVDSLMNNPLCISTQMKDNASPAMQNWISDVVMAIVPKLSGVNNIDLAILNKGGIRVDMPEGTVTEGVMMSMFPFDNRFVVLEMTGKQLLDALKVMAGRDGDAISKELKVTYNSKGDITSAKVKGKKVDPKKTYRVATIDYLANGGDYMTPFIETKRLFVDEQKYGNHVINYLKQLNAQGKKIEFTDEVRMKKK